VVALKSWIFILLDSLLLQTLFSLLRDFQAKAFRVLISLSCVHQLPRYKKSWSPVSVSACLISVPSMLCRDWTLVLKNMALVFPAFNFRPTLTHSNSILRRSFLACSILLESTLTSVLNGPPRFRFLGFCMANPVYFDPPCLRFLDFQIFKSLDFPKICPKNAILRPFLLISMPFLVKCLTHPVYFDPPRLSNLNLCMTHPN